MPIKLIGTEPYQVPRNSDLGTMAYQDAAAISVGSISVTGNDVVSGETLSINNSGSGNALRITQTGTGNALVVEDSANPDSTPFVINNDGKIISGHTTSLYNGSLEAYSPSAEGFFLGKRYSADTGCFTLGFLKTRGNTPDSTVIVANGDQLGVINFQGTDGVKNVLAAAISGQVDGTPGLDDMPGRLVFSTTPDGTTTLTERMRIDSAGKVTIGASGTGSTQVALYVRSVGDYAGVNYGVYARQNLLSSTTGYYAFNTEPTINSGATITTVAHYQANSGTFNSTPTTQYGFYAGATLIGASNNYGFYSNIPTASNRWNFYAAGTADNYFNGNVGIGIAPISASYALSTKTGSYVSFGMPTDAWGRAGICADGATYTAGILYSHGAYRATWTCNGYRNTSNQWTSLAINGQTGASYIEQDPSGYITFNVDAIKATGSGAPVTERMRIASDGRVLVGGTLVAGRSLRVARDLTGATDAHGINSGGTILSDVTSAAQMFTTYPATQAASFTLASLAHYSASQSTFGAGSTVTNQYGFIVNSSLTGATNNYGFYSNIPASTGDWNFYANGTAQNYFAGNTSIGALPSGSNRFEVTGDTKLTGALWVTGAFEQSQQAVAALDVDCSTGNFFTKTIAADSTFTFSNVPSSGVAYAMTIEITHTSGTITWPTSVKWNNDRAPALTTGKTHLFTFVTYNGGARWRASALVDYVN